MDTDWMPRLSSNGSVRSAHDLVAREIAMHILNGDYPPGSLLPNESELIESFQVSRTALREALKTLAAKGLIVAKTKIGTRVLPSSYWNFYDPQVLSWRLLCGVDADFIAKLFEVRQAIEPAAAALAASRRDENNLRRMQSFLDSMNKPHDSHRSFAEPDLHFHQEVLTASRNPFIQSFSTIIEASIFCAFEISAPIGSVERLSKAVARHQRVLDAISRGDPDAANRAMSEVISRGIENARIGLAAKPITLSLPVQIRAA